MNFSNQNGNAPRALTLAVLQESRKILRIALLESRLKERCILSWAATYPLQSMQLVKFPLYDPDSIYLAIEQCPIARMEFSIERRVLTATFNPRFECAACWKKVGMV